MPDPIVVTDGEAAALLHVVFERLQQIGARVVLEGIEESRWLGILE
jgi:hypothetical protein